MSDYRSKKALTLRLASLMVLIITLTGILGYMFIESMAPLDALYMTIITIATVGFKEVTDLSDSGKVFTILLIIISLGTFAYALSIITTQLVEGEVRNVMRGYRKKQGIRKMKNHVIVCGYGRNGQQTVVELKAYQRPFVVIDQKSDVLDEANDPSLNFIKGDATEEKVLRDAGIDHAEALITTLPIDADNLYVALTARSLNPSLMIISRATNLTAERKLKLAGVNNVVMPEKVGGAHMAMLVARRDLLEFLDHLSVHGNAPTNLEEVECDCLSDKNKDRSLQKLDIRERTGVNIVGYKNPEGEFIINPGPETELNTASKLFVLGTPEQVMKLRKILCE